MYHRSSINLLPKHPSAGPPAHAPLLAPGEIGCQPRTAAALLFIKSPRFNAVRHEVDKAFEWLQIAFENHDGGMPRLLVDPLLRDLRDDPRYMAMLKKVGLPGS